MKKTATSFRLVRGDDLQVTNLLSAFGPLRETTLTATLGYLISLNRQIAVDLFKLVEPISVIALESQSDDKKSRFDIAIEDRSAKHLIEAKIDLHSPTQLHRYLSNNPNIIVIGKRLRFHLTSRELHNRFYTWDEISDYLIKSTKNQTEFYSGLVDNFINHLREHNMTKNHLKDVYLRDLSGDSVEWYFNRKIYFTQPRYFDAAKQARYFAPYLTKSNASAEGYSVFNSLGAGISFVSRIETVQLLQIKDIPEFLKKKSWTKVQIDEAFRYFEWRKTSKADIAIFELGTPLRLFQRPVTKKDLWGFTPGAMPPMSIDFGDLIAASNGITLKKKPKAS